VPFDLKDLKKKYKPWHFMAVVGALAAVFSVWFYVNGTPTAPDGRDAFTPPQDTAGSAPPLLSSAPASGNKIQVTIRPRISAMAIVKIMDHKNNIVKVLFKGRVDPGEYTYDWNKKNEKGKVVSAGKYYCLVSYPDIHMETRSGLDVQ
jgi:hypothetical protein